ncbi:CREB-regulated transcription coactivator 1-like isoform X1 [Rhodnius prolixus]|uniref:Putative creb-regulated transcription coactivator 1 n=1 Tax=Rhodnius neglectus TaxID=72488 RepID=A0A0P4VP59_9HEMI
MANPRKFSEKIAMHNQKQAEETAEFERIMREVSDATNKSGSSEEQKVSGSSQNYRQRPRSCVGPMRSRPGEKRLDTCPYSGPYLSPPPDSPWRRTHSDSSLHTSSHDRSLEGHSQLVEDYDRRSVTCTPEGRPRSAPDVPRVPGISVYPSQQEPGTVQIPIGNNTGSLPDLTHFHFPPPLNTPLDRDEQATHFHGSQSGSPRSLSPTPLPQMGRYVDTPPNEAPGPPLHINATNQLFVPSHAFHKCHQHNKGRPQDYQAQILLTHVLPPITSLQQTYTNQRASVHQLDGSVHQNSPHQSSTNSQPIPQSLTLYKYGSSSPCTSPQSPASPISISSGCAMSSSSEHNSNYFVGQANALHHHFEQFSMSDDNSRKMRNHELVSDANYYSTSPQQPNYRSALDSSQTTPNTPSSIPDIILTDFSNSEELTKDFGATMVGSLEGELFPNDECLMSVREGLDPIDFDGLQMLTDPEMITDAATEHHLRLDRLSP